MEGNNRKIMNLQLTIPTCSAYLMKGHILYLSFINEKIKNEKHKNETRRLQQNVIGMTNFPKINLMNVRNRNCCVIIKSDKLYC